jgi:hypothetical protein
MPTPSEQNHLALANKNNDALLHVMSDPAKYAEWITTIAYYKAVQVVEAVLANRGQRSSSHANRLTAIKKIRVIRAVQRSTRPMGRVNCCTVLA